MLEAVCPGISLDKQKNLHFKDSTEANGEHPLPKRMQWKAMELGLLSVGETGSTTYYLGDQRKVSCKMGD